MTTRSRRLHSSWEGNAVIFVVSIGLSYGFLSLALDSAKTLDYVAAIIFLVIGVKSLIKTIKLVGNRG